MGYGSLFEKLAEAKAQPSRAYRDLQSALGAVDDVGEGYMKGIQIGDAMERRAQDKKTLEEVLGGPVEGLAPNLQRLPFGRIRELGGALGDLSRFSKKEDENVSVMTDEDALKLGKVPKGTKVVSTGSDARSDRNTISGLRKEFLKESKEFSDISNRISNVFAGAKNPSAAGDLSLIFSYMKMLDPSSTVREGEFATAANTGSVPDVLRSRYNKVISGERLAPDVRADFVRRSVQIYQAQKRNHKQREVEYKRLAAAQGVDPSQAIINMET
jgi:hypothetical protein